MVILNSVSAITTTNIHPRDLLTDSTCAELALCGAVYGAVGNPAMVLRWWLSRGGCLTSRASSRPNSVRGFFGRTRSWGRWFIWEVRFVSKRLTRSCHLRCKARPFGSWKSLGQRGHAYNGFCIDGAAGATAGRKVCARSGMARMGMAGGRALFPYSSNRGRAPIPCGGAGTAGLDGSSRHNGT